MARPLTDTLRLLDDGVFLARASELMAAMVRGVDDTGRPGKLTLTLDVKRGSKGAMLIVPHVATKVPEDKPEATMLWATTEGNLTVDNPRQQKLDLRQVDSATVEIRVISTRAGTTGLDPRAASLGHHCLLQ